MQFEQDEINSGVDSDLAVQEEVDCETQFTQNFLSGATVFMILQAVIHSYLILVLYTHWMNSDKPV